VKNGRQRGDFVGNPTDLNGFVLLADGSQLVTGCHDGRIRFWDFENGVNTIKKFERSLTLLP
jgi:WD40 repeat protein